MITYSSLNYSNSHPLISLFSLLLKIRQKCCLSCQQKAINSSAWRLSVWKCTHCYRGLTLETPSIKFYIIEHSRMKTNIPTNRKGVLEFLSFLWAPDPAACHGHVERVVLWWSCRAVRGQCPPTFPSLIMIRLQACFILQLHQHVRSHPVPVTFQFRLLKSYWNSSSVKIYQRYIK